MCLNIFLLQIHVLTSPTTYESIICFYFTSNFKKKIHYANYGNREHGISLKTLPCSQQYEKLEIYVHFIFIGETFSLSWFKPIPEKTFYL